MYCCLVFMSNTHTHPHTRHMWEAKMTAGCAVLSVFLSCSLLRNGTKEHTIHIPYLAGHSFMASMQRFADVGYEVGYIWSFEFVPLLRRSGQSCQLVSSLVHML